MILRAALLAPCRASAGRCCSARLVRALAHHSRQRVMAAAAARDVRLTEQEKELFSVLRAVVEHACPQTVLRCAGGWVRDKLLGKESHDIDIALSDKKGVEFAEDVNKYLASQAQSALKVAARAAPCLLQAHCQAPHQAPAPRRTPTSCMQLPARQTPASCPIHAALLTKLLCASSSGRAIGIAWRPRPQPCCPGYGLLHLIRCWPEAACSPPVLPLLWRQRPCWYAATGEAASAPPALLHWHARCHKGGARRCVACQHPERLGVVHGPGDHPVCSAWP